MGEPVDYAATEDPNEKQPLLPALSSSGGAQCDDGNVDTAVQPPTQLAILQSLCMFS
jgi:hypothetical protein